MDGSPHIEGAQATGPTGLMPRATVYELEAHRNRSIELFAATFDTLKAAHEASWAAAPSGRFETINLIAGSPYSRSHHDVSDREKYLAWITKQIDRGVWGHVVKATNLDKLMDKAEREAFARQCEENPPPATAENVLATMERLLGDADLIFKRGIANAFSKLDRRFRSHDGFKIGSRMVLSRAFNDFGSWNHYANHADTLIDVERVFHILDHKPQPDRMGGIVGKIDEAKRNASRGLKLQQFEVEDDYYRVVVYGNGNAHLWFKRKDLVQKVNLILADYYGAAVGAAPDVADRKHGYAVTPAKNFGFFPSPQAVVLEVLQKAGLTNRVGVHDRGYETKRRHILEPSGGEGDIAFAAAALGHEVDAVEIQAELCAKLSASGALRRVVHADFLDRSVESLGQYDVILMNPPFDGGRDVDHVTHALQFLVPGGVLVAVMSAGTEFREDRKTADFRKEVERRGGRFFDLPPGSFAESGTMVNTVLCCIGRSYWS